jgi:hypothetical protein
MSIDSSWVANELTAIDALGHEPQEKGKRLETLVATIFSLVSGLQYEGANLLNFYRTEEVDLLFWNDRERDGVHFLDCPLIIECKSSKTPLSGRDLRYFATMLRDKGRSSGVLVALAGVAGDEEAVTAGFYHMTASLIEGVTVLVVTRDDLLALQSGADLVALLKRRLLSVVKSQVLQAAAAVR